MAFFSDFTLAAWRGLAIGMARPCVRSAWSLPSWITLLVFGEYNRAVGQGVGALDGVRGRAAWPVTRHRSAQVGARARSEPYRSVRAQRAGSGECHGEGDTRPEPVAERYRTCKFAADFRDGT